MDFKNPFAIFINPTNSRTYLFFTGNSFFGFVICSKAISSNCFDKGLFALATNLCPHCCRTIASRLSIYPPSRIRYRPLIWSFLPTLTRQWQWKKQQKSDRHLVSSKHEYSFEHPGLNTPACIVVEWCAYSLITLLHIARWFCKVWCTTLYNIIPYTTAILLVFEI